MIRDLAILGILSAGAIGLFLIAIGLAWLATRPRGYWF